MGASGLVDTHLEKQSIKKADLQLASSNSIWSGDDVVASGCGYTLRDCDSILTFLVGRCFNISCFPI